MPESIEKRKPVIEKKEGEQGEEKKKELEEVNIEEILSLPVVKRFGLSREQIEEGIKRYKKRDGGLWTITEQGLEVMDVTDELNIEGESFADHEELRELFAKMTKGLN